MATITLKDGESGGSVKDKMAWLSGAFDKGCTTENTLPRERENTVSSRKLIADRMKWIESTNEKKSMTSSVKDQNVGSGIIAKQKEWLKETSKKQLEAQVSSPKDQNVGSGIIAKQKDWLKEQNQIQLEGQIASQKDQNVGSGIIARQKDWLKEQTKKQLEAQVASPKDQNVGSGIIARQQDWFKETSKKHLEAQVSSEKDQGSLAGSGIIAKQKQWVQEEKQRFQAVKAIKSPRGSAANDNKFSDAAPTQDSPTSVRKVFTLKEDEGCYLTYESDSGGRLMLHYVRGLDIPDNAVGFWTPGAGKSIQGFKFKQAGGRSELIKGIAGGDANRRKYFSGWCQYLKLAKAMNAHVKKLEGGQGVEVDVYGYRECDSQPCLLDLNSGLVDIADFDAVAVIPKHKSFLQGVKSLVLPAFLEKGNLAGASTTLA
mmetsp:Transcript_28199/g.39675  ORF Transcript_28199/g.39675 Transcript_28199/m.39675 type:complete len:429 (+) Transcript_28199:60-1346(+)